jgi:hypothetical protein
VLLFVLGASTVIYEALSAASVLPQPIDFGERRASIFGPSTSVGGGAKKH